MAVLKTRCLYRAIISIGKMNTMKQILSLLIALAMCNSMAAQSNNLIVGIGLDSINLSSRKAYVSVYARTMSGATYQQVDHFNLRVRFNRDVLSNPVLHYSPSPNMSNVVVSEPVYQGDTIALIENNFNLPYGFMIQYGFLPTPLMSLSFDINPNASLTDSLKLERLSSEMYNSPTEPWVVNITSAPLIVPLGYCTTPSCQPIAVDDYSFTIKNTPVHVDMLANDISHGNLPLMIGHVPAHYFTNGVEMLQHPAGFVMYLPNPNWTGLDSGMYIVYNNYYQADSFWVYVNVVDSANCVPSQPVNLSTSTTTICRGDTLQLGINSGFLSEWYSPGNYTTAFWWSSTDSIIPFSSIQQSGFYRVNVFDEQGCHTSDSIYISVMEPPSGHILVSGDLCNGDPWQGGQLQLCYQDTSNSNYTLQYTWSTGETTPCINLNNIQGGGLFIVQAGDFTSACVDQDSFMVNIPTAILPSIQISSPQLCGLDSSILLVQHNPDYQFTWSNGSQDDSITVDSAGVYTLSVTQLSTGCTATAQAEVLETECIWPGDANYDGTANNQDILEIGLAYNQTGPTRTDNSIGWYGHAAPADWPNAFLSGLNHKHADCDGSGLVDFNDTLAVVQNYNAPAHPMFGRNNSGGATLAIDFQPSIVTPNSPASAIVSLGTQGLPATDVYGLAFSIVFADPDNIVPGSMHADFSQSLFNQAGLTLDLYRYHPNTGTLDLAVSRTDQQSFASYSGEVLRVNFIIEDNIDSGPTLVEMATSFNNIRMIDQNGNEMGVSTRENSLFIDTLVSSTEVIDYSPLVQLYPNPTSHVLNIQNFSGLSFDRILLYNSQGAIISDEVYRNSIDCSTLSSGMYHVVLQSDTGLIRKVFVKN